MAESYIEVTKENFAEKVLNASNIVIVNFSAEQSGACQIQEPEFVAMSQEYQGRVTFAKLDVEKQASLTNQWNVDGVPTLIFFSRGREIHRVQGIVMRNKLRRLIDGVLLVNY